MESLHCNNKNWQSVYLPNLIKLIAPIGNKKIKVLMYLISKMDGDNQINTTYEQIQEDTGVSFQVITDTFKALKKYNLIKKYGGVYVFNCSIISVCGSEERNAYFAEKYGFNNDDKGDKK